MIIGITSQNINAMWPVIKPYVDEVLIRFDVGYDADHVKNRLLDRGMQLWLCNDSAIAISEIEVMPEFKVLSVPIASGNEMEQWLEELVTVLKAFAKHHDCKYFDVCGRKGWLKTLKPLGFQEYAVITRCKL